MEENQNCKELILVCGVDGSGRSTFAQCFKNSFMQSLPAEPLYQGLLGGSSFVSTSSLIDSKHIEYIKKAHLMGYKITVYYIFAGKLLSIARNRFRLLADGHSFDEQEFKKTYESSYKGLLEIYEYIDLVFFIRNQKEYEFLVAYSPSETNFDDFKEAVKKTKTFVDRIK